MTNAFDQVNDLMEEGVGNVFPGGVLRVAVEGKEVFHRPFGTLRPRGQGTPVRHGTVFDTASLTKCVSIASLIMKGVDEGWCDLSTNVCKKLGPIGGHAEMPLHLLLSHRSGLPNWRPYLDWLFERHSDIEPGTDEAIALMKQWILNEPLVNEVNQLAHYSDLGYMILGWWLEETMGDSLNHLFETHVAKPLRMKSTRYIPTTGWDAVGSFPCQNTMAPAEICPGRKRLAHGEVHDENAFVLGGIAGHAGLFSNAEDLGTWADALMSCHETSGFISRESIRTFWAPIPTPDDSTWRLGFDGVSPARSSGGRLVNSSGVCHLGFTGASIWIDPERKATTVLLTNRVHPSRENNLIRDFRPVLHDAIWSAIDETHSL